MSIEFNEGKWKKRLAELCDQSRYTNSYIFTDFLSPLEASFAYEICDDKNRTIWGGHKSAERVMIRFGNPDGFGYEQEFPIRILQISPQNDKFAEKLNHRDYLGALVHLGIDRSVLGDILVTETGAYVFAHERMADFVEEQLFRVRHTAVTVTVTDQLPADAKPHLEQRELVVSSSRLDGVISKLYGLSRSEAKAAFSRQEVFRNGRLVTNTSVVLSEGDIISVRHHGKFIYEGMTRTTKKGNERISVQVYV